MQINAFGNVTIIVNEETAIKRTDTAYRGVELERKVTYYGHIELAKLFGHRSTRHVQPLPLSTSSLPYV